MYIHIFCGMESVSWAMLRLKRVYDPPAVGDGMRILVDRLWPRGIAKVRARIDFWLKEIAPSHALRKRFHGQPQDWDAFCAAYAAELESDVAQAAGKELVGCKGTITLLYAARNEERNNAVALKSWLERRRKRGGA